VFSRGFICLLFKHAGVILAKDSSTYRADIDGLRSLAVVPVVLFHAGVPFLGGGYIGVDIFFVISGFLITSIIASEVDAGHFSIASFYDRRVRRILPALVAVISFCVAVGFVLLTPSDYKNVGESVLAATFFVSNIYFWRKTGYFEARSSEQPLLHTWSLSIEEQFYVGYPLLLILISKAPRVRIPLLLILCLSSLAASIALVYYKPSAAFYLGPTRAWELLFGGLISLKGRKFTLCQNQNTVAALIGLALILFPICLYTPSTKFPGVAAIPPVLGSGLLIWTGINSTTLVHKLLSTNVFTSVGKASYSLYLWHWPLLVFARYANGGALSPLVTAIVCLLSLLISLASLRYIEKPFRFPAPSRHRRYVATALLGAAMVGSLGFVINVGGGIPSRLDMASKGYLEAEHDRERNHTECMSLEDFILPPSRACKFGATNVEPTALLWGDSHAMVTAIAMEQSALKNNGAFIFAASVDCPIGLGFGIDQKTGPAFVATAAYHYCEQYNTDMLKLAIASPNIRSVVLSSRWTNWRIGEPGAASEEKVDIRLYDETGTAKSKDDNKRIFLNGFEKLIQALAKSGKTIWIVGPLPEPSARIPKALYVKHLGFSSGELDIPISDFFKKNDWILTLFKKIGVAYPVRFIWPHAVLCGENMCPVAENGHPLFFDDNHLSVVGIRKTSPLYDEIFSR
jgi:peptidoglycan/LPS O-acetylase OafA/YrhL